MARVRIVSNSPGIVEVPGLGLQETNVWFDVSPEQGALYEAANSRPLVSDGALLEVEGTSVPVEEEEETPVDPVEDQPESEGGEEEWQ